MTPETPESTISIILAPSSVQSTVPERECTGCRRRREAQRILRGSKQKPTGVTKKKMPPRTKYVSTYSLESQSGPVAAPGRIVTDPSSPLSVATTETDVSLVNIPPSPYYLSHITTPLLKPYIELQNTVVFDPEGYIGSENDAEGETDDEIFRGSNIKGENIEGQYETYDEFVSKTSTKNASSLSIWKTLFSFANLKQDLMRCPSPIPTSTHINGDNIPARINFLIEEYARAVRLQELHGHWRSGPSSLNNVAAADMVRELDLISKRIIPGRPGLWRFEGREALTPWQPLLNWVTTYSAETSKVRSETEDKLKHFGKTKALLNALLNTSAEIMWDCETLLGDTIRDLGIALSEADLRKHLQRVRNQVMYDCSERGCLLITTLVTEGDIDFFNFTKPWKKTNYLRYINDD